VVSLQQATFFPLRRGYARSGYVFQPEKRACHAHAAQSGAPEGHTDASPSIPPGSAATGSCRRRAPSRFWIC
jgi:hypothetical protein